MNPLSRECRGSPSTVNWTAKAAKLAKAIAQAFSGHPIRTSV